MAKDLNNSVGQNSPHAHEDDAEKSLVGKFKSIISNTSLSKWFRRQEDNVRSTVRRRDENDDEFGQMQPPAKRAKFPNVEGNNFGLLSSTTVAISTSDNTVISEKLNKTYNHFPEPVAGPSGLKSRKLLNNVNIPASSARSIFTNDIDSDSEESTSGYSSVARIGSKEHVSQSGESSKQHSPLQNNSPNTRSLFQSPVVSTNRSLFTERTASPNLNASLSSRRPCFNASTFGSPNFIDKTISTEKIINSPFYNGKTIYGGASAYGRKLGRSAKDLKASLKRSVHIKPVNKTRESGSLILGKTARKILETLEQYSSPVNDAKKIPVAPKRIRLDNSLLGEHIGVNPYISQSGAPPIKELQVPTVSDLLKMKQKAKLQSSTETVRQIAISSKSDLNAVSPQPVLNISNKNQNKPENSKVDKKKEKIKDSVPNDKPPFSTGLPISSLSKFDSNVRSPVAKKSEKTTSSKERLSGSPTLKPQTVQQSQTTLQMNRSSQKDVSCVNPQFKFSDPLVIAENLKSIVAMNNFKFSEPLSKANKTDHSSILTSPISKPVKEKNNGQNTIKDILPNSVLLDKFKPAAGTWECGTCLIRNQSDKSRCVACDSPNPKLKPAQPEIKTPVKTSTSSFGEVFKMPDNMWECPVCMIRNSNTSAKCIACETVNPKSMIVTSSSSGFQGIFKPPSNTWECSTCMIRNKEELSKCAACETPRIPPPATNKLANSFKIKEDEWECSVCLVRNKSTYAKCQCCEAFKPGSNSNVIIQKTEKKPVPKFNFGIDKKTAASFSFGIPTSSTVPNLPKPVIEPISTFAEPAKTNNTSTPPTFSFGVTRDKEKKEKSADTSDSSIQIEITKPLEVAKPLEEALKPVENKALVKPLGTIPEKSEDNINAVSKNKSETNSAPPVNTSKSLGSIKPSFNFNVKFDNTSKDTSSVAPIPKFEFTKPTVNPPKETVVVPESQKIQSAVPNSVFNFGTTKPVNSTKPPVFGQSNLAANNGLDVKSTTPSVPSFGTSIKPSFGMSSKPSLDLPVTKSTETKPFSFTKPDSGEPAIKVPMFSFDQPTGTSLNPTTTQPSGFGFGPITKSPLFNFSASKSDTAVGSASGNLFGASNTTGNSKNGIFNFGSATQNPIPQKTGFNFGTPAAPSTGFNFSAATTGAVAPAAPPATGGFNFTAAFDSSTKPSFNFAESPVTFSAQPLPDSGLAPRKIRRAVRRTR